MKIDNEVVSRQRELSEHTTVTHMLCIVILTSALILCKKVYITDNIYPVINLRFFALISLFGLGIIFLLRSKDAIPFEAGKSVSYVELGYVAFPLLIVATTVIMAGDCLDSVDTILLLPVLITASILGKRAGLVMATVCTILLLVYGLSVKTPLPVIFESNLLNVSMMYLVGWFVGGVIKIEACHRAQLKTSLDSLKEEIARRKKVEEQLRKLTRAIEQGPSIVVITDTFGRIEYVNKKFTQVTGYSPEEATGRTISEIEGIPPEQYEQIWKTVNAGREWRGELYKKKKNGDYYWELTSVCPFRNNENAITNFLNVSEDITESKRIEKEIARLDRLNLVGEMAAGLGHEIRNPMTSVRGFLQLLSGKKECSIYRDYFDLMIEELDRANSIINEYLSMAKDKAIVLERKTLSSIVEALRPLITSDANKFEIKVVFHLEELPALLLDEKEIRQLILNLVRNGLEAMRPGGTLTIKTYTEDDMAVLAVEDQGSGISPEVLEKIGTPFFTTKDTGTGLGLAMCYSIASRHNASLKVETGPGGTTFYVMFKFLD